MTTRHDCETANESNAQNSVSNLKIASIDTEQNCSDPQAKRIEQLKQCNAVMAKQSKLLQENEKEEKRDAEKGNLYFDRSFCVTKLWTSRIHIGFLTFLMVKIVLRIFPVKFSLACANC